MMLKRELTPKDGCPPGAPRRRSRVGSTAFAMLAGAAVLCVGTVAAVLAGVHDAQAASSGTCQALPAAPSSPPGSPSPTLTPSAAGPGSPVTKLCVSVAAKTGTVEPGHADLFQISVWPTGGTASNVTVQISVTASDSSPSFAATVFTVCGAGHGTQTCKLGTLKAGQAIGLQAQVSVPSPAPSGDTATLTSTANGAATGATSTGSVSAIASFTVVPPPPPPTSPSPSPSPSPTPTHPSSPPPTSGHHGHHHSSSGHSHGSGTGSSGVGTTTLPSGLGTSGLSSGLGTTTSPVDTLPLGSSGSGSNPASLFPTIAPSSGSSSAPVGAHSGKAAHTPYHPRTVADILPLNKSQLGSQVAGLVVLALGVIIAIARVSLRKPRTQAKP